MEVVDRLRCLGHLGYGDGWTEQSGTCENCLQYLECCQRSIDGKGEAEALAIQRANANDGRSDRVEGVRRYFNRQRPKRSSRRYQGNK